MRITYNGITLSNKPYLILKQGARIWLTLDEINVHPDQAGFPVATYLYRALLEYDRRLLIIRTKNRTRYISFPRGRFPHMETVNDTEQTN